MLSCCHGNNHMQSRGMRNIELVAQWFKKKHKSFNTKCCTNGTLVLTATKLFYQLIIASTTAECILCAKIFTDEFKYRFSVIIESTYQCWSINIGYRKKL